MKSQFLFFPKGIFFPLKGKFFPFKGIFSSLEGNETSLSEHNLSIIRGYLKCSVVILQKSKKEVNGIKTPIFVDKAVKEPGLSEITTGSKNKNRVIRRGKRFMCRISIPFVVYKKSR